MGFTLSLVRVREEVAALRGRMARPSRATLLRLLLWAVIAGAVSAYVWVLWTESISRR